MGLLMDHFFESNKIILKNILLLLDKAAYFLLRLNLHHSKSFLHLN